ncbi:MAG: ATP-binding protein [Gammaproteobacteria bacterium]|nr:ATP-binding protein [Gammaproteobacteria bacterium]
MNNDSLRHVFVTPDQLNELVAADKSELLEFKASTGARREAAATVYAILNQRVGHVLFGVTPKTAIVGQSIGDRTIEDGSAGIQRIDPPAFPEVDRVQVSANRFTRRWRHARRSRMHCATATTPRVAAPSVSPFTMTAWK